MDSSERNELLAMINSYQAGFNANFSSELVRVLHQMEGLSNDTNVSSSCHFSKHRWLEEKLVLMSGVGTVIALFGICGNVITALVLSRPTMRSANNLYLTALAIYDCLLLVTAILIYSVEYIVEHTNNFEMYVIWLTYLPVVFAISHISQTGSVYITVAVTFERYFALVHAKHKVFITQRQGAKVAIGFVSLFAIFFNCTKFFEIDIRLVENCTRFESFAIDPGSVTNTWSYQVIFSLWIVNIVMVFFPFLTLFLFNSIIAWSIRRALRERSISFQESPEHKELKRRSREATQVLVIIVMIFLVCNLWGFVIALMERIYGIITLVQNFSQFYAFSREAINFLAIVNASVNFVIYIIFGQDFRAELRKIFGCGRQRWLPKASDTPGRATSLSGDILFNSFRSKKDKKRWAVLNTLVPRMTSKKRASKLENYRRDSQYGEDGTELAHFSPSDDEIKVTVPHENNYGEWIEMVGNGSAHKGKSLLVRSASPSHRSSLSDHSIVYV